MYGTSATYTEHCLTENCCAAHSNGVSSSAPDTDAAPDLQTGGSCSLLWTRQAAPTRLAEHAAATGGGQPPPEDGKEPGKLSWLWSKDDFVTYGLAIVLSLFIRE